MEAQENKKPQGYRNQGLLPCPFCGETEKIALRRGRFGDAFVACFSCHCTTGFFENGKKPAEQAAKDAWNMRREPIYVIREEEKTE